MKNFFSLLLITTFTSLSLPIHSHAEENYVPSWLRAKYNAYSIFEDMPADHPYYQYAVDLFRQGVINGYGGAGRSMGPDNQILRAEVTKVLAFASELTIATQLSESSFTDVSPDDWFFPFVENMYRFDMINGYGDGTFGPANPVTFGQTLKLVTVVMGLSENMNTTGDNWATPYYDFLIAKNIIPSEMRDKDFNETMTRAEVFALVSRALTMKDSGTATFTHTIKVDIPEFEIKNLTARSTMLTDSSVWLSDLSNSNAGYYYDYKHDNHIVFAHSSVWDGDSAEPIFKPILERGMDERDFFTLTINGTEKIYHVLSMEMIHPREVEKVLDADPEVDAILFTCGMNYNTERWLVKATEVKN